MDRDFQAVGYGTNYDGGGYRRNLGKRSITDYGLSTVQWMQHRQQRYLGGVRMEIERPTPSYVIDVLPPGAKVHSAADTIPARHLHTSLNKVKHPVNVVRWTPEGRRLLTGSNSGEFTLWNGMGFNFETIMQAHDSQIRAISYSHGEDWVVSADQEGVVKYWQTNFNNVKAIQAHNECIRDLSFSPNDSKFVTASDDASLKIFDFAGGTEESTLTGHNWEAKTVDWHPTKGLLVSGSKDHQVKLWDPRTGRVLTTLHGHKAAVSKVLFEPLRGQLLATGARDNTARIFDLRMMRDTCLLRGAEKDISTLIWHPIHVNLLTTGGLDGSIMHYLLDEPHTPAGTAASLGPYDSTDPSNAPVQGIWPAHRLQHAHEYAVWSLAWHPLGHILASGSNDRTTRFWTRPRPGDVDCFRDRYHLGDAAAETQGTWDRRNNKMAIREQEEQEAEDEADGLVDQKMPAVLPGLPGLAMPTNGFSDGTSTGGAQKQVPTIPENFAAPPPPPPISDAFPGMDPKTFAALVATGQIPPPLPNGFPPPPMPLPPDFDFSKLPPGMPPPPGFVPPPLGGLPGVGTGAVTAAGRRRAPLPSQQESLMEQQRQGYFKIAR